MILIVNPNAGGGTALGKLNAIEQDIRSRYGDFTIALTQSPKGVRSLVRRHFRRGIRRFVAAGGDGCVNSLISAIMSGLSEEERRKIAVGALGLGSSNDFHKPLSTERLISGIPTTMDFGSSRLRDVVMLEFPHNGTYEQRYCLVNASAGLTAEANRFFNHPDALLSVMKRRMPDAAILYAAFRTIVLTRNYPITIGLAGEEPVKAHVTNLAILKSPHVSGGMKYPGQASYDSGFLQVHLASGLHLGGRIGLFRALAAGRMPRGKAMSSSLSRGGMLSSESRFPFEFDGEVIMTNTLRFWILPRHLRVCTC